MELILSKWFHPHPFSIAKQICYEQVQLGFIDFNLVELNKYIIMHLRYEQVQLGFIDFNFVRSAKQIQHGMITFPTNATIW
jgi:hypothetical protein